MRTLLLCMSIAPLLAFGALSSAPAAHAQSGCRAVNVVEVRGRRVEVFDLEGTPISTVPREELGAITRAQECPAMPNFLGVRVNGQRLLVRRTALRLEVAELERPVCAEGQYASHERRNASSSGIGGAACRQPD